MPQSRREFVRRGAVTTVGAAALLGADRAPAADRPIPRRTLGRTGAKVSIIGFGAAPLGHSFQPQEVFDRVVGRAIDAGVNYIDTATTYDVSQERLGPIIKHHRDKLFLVTKSRGRDKDGVLKTVEESLRLLQTDHVDVVHIHNVADYDVDRLTDENGPMQGLLEARKRGWLRFIGATAHMRVERMAKVLDTGLVDVMMVTLNFVDQHTYGYETKVLPVARKHRTGIVAMKVLGGAPNFNYRQPRESPLPPELIPNAIRYPLSLDGVACAVIGFSWAEQVDQAAGVARSFKRLAPAEMAALSDRGREIAATWKEHLGPVAG